MRVCSCRSLHPLIHALSLLRTWFRPQRQLMASLSLSPFGTIGQVMHAPLFSRTRELAIRGEHGEKGRASPACFSPHGMH